MGNNMDNNKTLSSQLEGTLHITPTQHAEQSEIRQPSNCKQLTNFTCTPIQYPYTPMSFSQNWMTSRWMVAPSSSSFGTADKIEHRIRLQKREGEGAEKGN
jgi:hypothetical protein